MKRSALPCAWSVRASEVVTDAELNTSGAEVVGHDLRLKNEEYPLLSPTEIEPAFMRGSELGTFTPSLFALLPGALSSKF